MVVLHICYNIIIISSFYDLEISEGRNTSNFINDVNMLTCINKLCSFSDLCQELLISNTWINHHIMSTLPYCLNDVKHHIMSPAPYCLNNVRHHIIYPVPYCLKNVRHHIQHKPQKRAPLSSNIH